MKKRFEYYDIVKGIAILLVVFAHVIQCFSPDFEHNTLALTIYAFHMPLFMIVTGKFFLSSLSKVTLGEFIRKRFLRLYLPSLVWGFIGLTILGG